MSTFIFKYETIVHVILCAIQNPFDTINTNVLASQTTALQFKIVY